MNGIEDSNARWVPLSEVHRWAKNPRINKDAIPKVAQSIQRFGFVSPVIVWPAESRVVAGHTRTAALESLLAADPGFIPPGAPPGVLPGMVPVRFHAFASEAEATAYAIADNRLNELAQWDTALLPELLGSLDATLAGLTGFSVDLPAFDPSALPGSTVLSPEAESATPEEATKPPRDRTVSVIHYDLIFETGAQQDEWVALLKHVRGYPGETHAARVLAFATAARTAGV